MSIEFSDLRSPKATSRHMDTFTYSDLLQSAESVLRGRKLVGPLRHVNDEPLRRLMAANLFWRQPWESIEERWLCDFLGIADGASAIQFQGKEICGCGMPPGDHPDDDSMRSPLWWHQYRDTKDIPRVVRHRRDDAIQEFSSAIFLAVRAAHSCVEPSSLRGSAWRVLDAVDQGRPYLPELASFLRLPIKVIKASRKIKDLAEVEELSYRHARRVLRIFFRATRVCDELGESSCDLKIDAEERIRDLLCWVPSIDAIEQSAHLSIKASLVNKEVWGDDVFLPPGLTPAQKRSLLRALIRYLRVVTKHKGNKGFDRVPESTINALPVKRIELGLPCGWIAKTLISGKEIRKRWEFPSGIGHYATRVLVGDTQVWELRSPNGRNRIIIRARPPLGRSEHHDETELEIETSSFLSPVSPDALRAAYELLKHQGANGLKVTLW